MIYLSQCEGCYAPLGYHMEEWERGEVNVTWILCPMHEAETAEYSHDDHNDYNY